MFHTADEADSDDCVLAGETCDMYWLGKRNYLIGDDVDKREGYYIRDLCHPSNDGKFATTAGHDSSHDWCK